VSTPSKDKDQVGQLSPRAWEGIRLFNAGDFFQAHEALEEAWKGASSPQRELYQGILQIGLAYYQIRQGSYRGALKMFRRGQSKLASLGEDQNGIDVKGLREDAREVEDALKKLGRAGMAELMVEGFQPIRTSPGPHQGRQEPIP
jgi:predicted metal-dependent hydrolase